MRVRTLSRSIACAVAASFACAAAAWAPPALAQQQTTAAYAVAPFAQHDLDQMLAPIALYPDALLAQVLMASTYPLEVVQAARFVQRNPGLEGEALARAVEPMRWDSSVKALTQFPSVLAMMNEELDWTERLGEAFLAQREQVMATVQALRAKAYAHGSLRSNEQQRVIVEERVIIIEPWRAGVYWVPYYNPLIVFGVWWWPAYPPFLWVPPVIYRPPLFPTIYTVGIVWGPFAVVYPSLWYDPRPVWPGRYLVVNDVRVTNVIVTQASTPRPRVWEHDPAHRRGARYATPVVRDRYAPAAAARPSVRQPQAPAPAVREPAKPSAVPRAAEPARPGVGSQPPRPQGDRAQPQAQPRPQSQSQQSRPQSQVPSQPRAQPSMQSAPQPRPQPSAQPRPQGASPGGGQGGGHGGQPQQRGHP